jgi:hypothetical protein
MSARSQVYNAMKVNGVPADNTGNVTISASADSSVYATKNYVNALNAQWSVSRTTDSANFVFTNGSTVTQISDRGWILLGTTVASAASTIDFTGLTTAYSQYRLIGYEIDPSYTSGTELRLRVGTGAGPTYATGASDYSCLGVSHYNTTSFTAGVASTFANSDATIDYIYLNALYDNSANTTHVYMPGQGLLMARLNYMESNEILSNHITFIYTPGNRADGKICQRGGNPTNT